MRTFASFQNLSENFRNFVGPDSREDKLVWADRVWAILGKTYEKMGGVKGNGFASAQDMVDKLPFWKLYVKGDKVVAVFLYKDKGGRKIVAIGTDGSKLSKDIMTEVLKAGFGIGWGEISKVLLIFVMKNIGINVIRPFLLTPTEASKSLGVEAKKLTPDLLDSLGDTDKKTYKMFSDELKDYFYVREIGGAPYLKIALGTPGISIK